MLKITPIPCLADNYCWRVANELARVAVLVDAGDGPAALAGHAAASAVDGCELVGLLTTHWHADHSGGNEAVLKAHPGLRVFGGAGEDGRIPGLTHALPGGGEALPLPAGLGAVTAHATPGHTRGHVCFRFDADVELPSPWPAGAAAPSPAAAAAVPAGGRHTDGALFSGDAVFSGGCGKPFEGSAGDVGASLIALLSALPGGTLLYAGHEYTVSNYTFAAGVEPGNAALAARLDAARALRAAGAPTLPSTVALEAASNVFFRAGELLDAPAVRARMPGGRAAASAREANMALRACKDAGGVAAPVEAPAV